VGWLLFGGRGKSGAEITEKIPPCTGKNQAQPIFHRVNLFARSCFISIAHHISKSDADKDASRE
jgi:hypothetical protein